MPHSVSLDKTEPQMEFVWVVPREAILPSTGLHGFRALAPKPLEEDFLAPIRNLGFFMERRYAETHPEFKQPIPYVVVGRQGAGSSSEVQVLHLKRLSTQTESRLHHLESIGVGGHINPCDASAPTSPQATTPDLLAQACSRELHEELRLPAGPLPLSPLGVLNDDTTEVGSVHLGLVYWLDATALEVSIRETSAMTGDFASLPQLESSAASDNPPFESWSTLLLRSGCLAAAAESGFPSKALRI
ncbi:MAG: hypothetical protein DWQ01_20590 [Planctomycetota bacterium]|nr:MAG: hypothetical protein DWQ01_20590 [Planctomycetota bacterium]